MSEPKTNLEPIFANKVSDFAPSTDPAPSDIKYHVQELENISIRVRDGTILSARLWLPITMPADTQFKPRRTHRMVRSYSSPGPFDKTLTVTKVPGILEMIPYGKRHGTSHRDETQYSYIAKFGFACLRVDCRGTGESEGLLHDEYLPTEQLDAVDCIAWMRQQPWCTGKIGMSGISWGGFNALQVAMLKPEGLEGIIALCCSQNRYMHDVHYAGGCLLTDNISWSSFMTSLLALPPDPALVSPENFDKMWKDRLNNVQPWLKQWLDHQWYDEYWKQGSLCENWSAVGCSVLVASGWADGYRDMVPSVLKNLKLPEGKIARGLNGPWAHNMPHAAAPGPNIDWLGDVVSWWKYCLQGDKEKEEAWKKRPAYTAYMEEWEEPSIVVDYKPGWWVGEKSWPSKRIPDWTLYLQPNHQLLLEKPSVSMGKPVKQLTAMDISTNKPMAYICSALATGLDCGRLGYGQDPDYPLDQRNVDANSLCFNTEPLASDIHILGQPVVTIFISASEPLAQVHVRLCDVAPRTGQSVLVTRGLLNLTHWKSHEKGKSEQSQVGPNDVVKVEIPLGEIGHVFPTGNRIRLAISTSLWPLIWPSPRKTTLGVHINGNDDESFSFSALVLPVRPVEGGIGDLMQEARSAAIYAASGTSSGSASSGNLLDVAPKKLVTPVKTIHRRSKSLIGATRDKTLLSSASTNVANEFLLSELSPSLFRKPKTAEAFPRTTLRPTTLGTRTLETDYVTGNTVLRLTKDYGHFRDDNCGIERGDWTGEVFGVCDPKHRWGVNKYLGVTAWMEVTYGIEICRSAEWFANLKKEGRLSVISADDTNVHTNGWRIAVENRTRMGCTETHFLVETKLFAFKYAAYDGKRDTDEDPLTKDYSQVHEPGMELVMMKEWSQVIPRDAM